MPDIIQKPSNPLSAIRHAATKLLTAYKIAQHPEETNNTKAETLILEAIDLGKHAIALLRKR